MWSLFDGNKIREILKESLEKGSNLTLWQHSTQQMFQLEGRFIEAADDLCTLNLTKKWEEGSINIEEALYIHITDRDIIFKREKFKFDTGEISFKTPSELMVRERRRIQRFRFKYQDFKSVSFSYKGEDGDEVLNLGLIDLSIAGLSFVGTQEKVNRFTRGHEISIKHITDQELPEPIKGKVVSSEDFYLQEGLRERTNNNTLIRIGVEFDEAIDEVSFQSVQSLVKRTQRRTKGLEVEGFNGLSESEQMRTIKKVGEENPVLANHLLDNVESLDRLRYLTSEMKQTFWMQVNHKILAAALRLSSKELIYDLLSDVTDNMREEFLIELNIPKAPSAIEKAQDMVCDFISQKEREGRFVLSATSFVKYV